MKKTTITFDPGDVVSLKSTGPRMTVISVEDDTCHCAWFDEYTSGGHEFHTVNVPKSALDLHEEDE